MTIEFQLAWIILALWVVASLTWWLSAEVQEHGVTGALKEMLRIEPTAADRLMARLDVLKDQPLDQEPVEPAVLRKAAITEYERRRRAHSNLVPFKKAR